MVTTKEKIEIMQAYEDGIDVEFRIAGEWVDLTRKLTPSWSWGDFEYRVKVARPDEIDWPAVSPEWQFMAREANGRTYFYERKPSSTGAIWNARGNCVCVQAFASYRNNGAPWDKSLVERPSQENAND